MRNSKPQQLPRYLLRSALNASKKSQWVSGRSIWGWNWWIQNGEKRRWKEKKEVNFNHLHLETRSQLTSRSSLKSAAIFSQELKQLNQQSLHRRLFGMDRQTLSLERPLTLPCFSNRISRICRSSSPLEVHWIKDQWRSWLSPIYRHPWNSSNHRFSRQFLSRHKLCPSKHKRAHYHL